MRSSSRPWCRCALRGVRYRAIGATRLLRRNLLIYGAGGVIAPFVGIKLIDLLIHNVFGAWAWSRSDASESLTGRLPEYRHAALLMGG